VSSKPKEAKTFIVLHRNSSGGGPCNLPLGRYRVGAKNAEEAEQFLRDEIGKHRKVKTYYEDKNRTTPYGMVIKEC
jgi:hypothetical protein